MSVKLYLRPSFAIIEGQLMAVRTAIRGKPDVRVARDQPRLGMFGMELLFEIVALQITLEQPVRVFLLPSVLPSTPQS